MSENQMYSSLKDVTTPIIQVEVSKENGVKFAGGSIYIDANDELKPIADYIKMNARHNEDIDVSKIQFLYTTESKKDGKYVVGQLSTRSALEKTLSDNIDFFLTVNYSLWAELDIEHKIIQLDKLLCGISITVDNKSKKKTVDSKEFLNNLYCYGAEKVLRSSEAVDIAMTRILDEEKEQKKSEGKQKRNQEEV